MRHWPPPHKVKELRTWLGFVTYYASFVEGFASICSPFYHLHKNVPFKWTSECQQAFENLTRVTQAPVLGVPRIDAGPFILTSDASFTGFGATLTQFQDNEYCASQRRQMLWTDLVESFSSRILTNTRGTSVVIKNKTHFSENSTTGQPTGKKNTVEVELYDYSVLATSYKCGPCTAHATIKSQGGRGEPKTAEICRGLQLRWGANFGSPTSALSPRLRGTTMRKSLFHSGPKR